MEGDDISVSGDIYSFEDLEPEEKAAAVERLGDVEAHWCLYTPLAEGLLAIPIADIRQALPASPR